MTTKKTAAPQGTILRLIKTKTSVPVYGHGCEVKEGVYVRLGLINQVVKKEVFDRKYQWAE